MSPKYLQSDLKGIFAKVKEVHVGPSVTQYELEIKAGTKVSKLLSIQREIALALAAKDVRIQDDKLIWTEVEGAGCYVVEIIKGTERRTEQVDNSEFYDIKPGETYRVRSKTYNSEFKSSLYSESCTYSVKLDNPTLLKASTSRISWDQVAYAQGYYYKIGVNGEIKTTVNPVILPAKEGLKDGDEIYVQAYADGCISSDWVLIWTYTNNGK